MQKDDLIFSRSGSLQELIWSKYENFCSIFWIADPFATKLGLIVHYQKLKCFMEKSDCCVQGQGHSRILECQWMFVQMIFSELLNLLLPNVVWWCIIQAWELCAAWRMYTPVKFTACPKIFPVHLKALKKKFRNCLCASSHMGKCQQVLCCLSEPISLGINFYFWACAVRFLIGHCDFWTLGTSAMSCSWAWLTKPTSFNVMAAFAMKIVGHGWILSGISSKFENFLQTAPRLQAVDLRWLWAHMFASGSGSKSLWNQAKCTALFAELAVLCGKRSCCFHETCQFWSAPTKLRAES